MAMARDLATLAGHIRACRVCVESPQGSPLPHEPRPVFQESATARILIAGQAPGVRVHASGKSFTDPSGDRLRRWLDVSVEEFYNPDNFALAAMGFCFPGLDAGGSDLPPRRECAPLWRARLMDAMPQITMIICVGRFAMNWHLGPGRSDRMGEVVANWQSAVSRHPAIWPLPHPSWRTAGWEKRNPWFGEDILPALRIAVRTQIKSLS